MWLPRWGIPHLHALRFPCSCHFYCSTPDTTPRFLWLFIKNSDVWPTERKVSAQENEDLARSFSMQELEEVLKATKTDTSPGPDGLPVAFFKTCWPFAKDLILDILNGFALGRVDISRLNFGILSLIPKVQGVESIKQYRTIALINVLFNWSPKLMRPDWPR